MTLPPATQPHDAPRRVRSLNHYELLAELGSGGMATVFLGRAHGVAGFERLVAVKRCHPHLRDDETFVRMFLDEARLAARIRHPNVVATFDVFDEDAPCLVMEYVEGDSLAKLLHEVERRGERLPVPVALRVLVETLAGLHAAHELCGDDGSPLHLVHRDVSPHNVLLGVDGIARLTDFGIAKAESRAAVTSEGRLRGKLAYMAPELLASRQASRRSDVFAAGVVLWEALTGRRLYDASSDQELVDLVLRAAVPRPSRVAPEVPAALDAVVLKALDAEPEARFASAADFADALEHCATLATTRAMGAYVSGAFGALVAKRREVVRTRAGAAPQPAPSHAAPSRTASQTASQTVPFASSSSLPTPPAPRSGSRRVLYAAWMTAAAAALAAVGFGTMLYRLRHDTRASATPVPRTALVAPATDAPPPPPPPPLPPSPAVARAAETSDAVTAEPAGLAPRDRAASSRARPTRARAAERPRSTHDAAAPARSLPVFREL